MIICISGLAGCGKNTSGGIVAREMGLELVGFTFKSMARQMGISLEELQARAERDRKFDVQLDEFIVKEATSKDCVVVTWLAPWMVKEATLRVWLNCSLSERAKRIARRDSMEEKAALAHAKLRDAQNIARYKKLYKIDITKRDMFDLEINSERLKPEQAAKIIICAAQEKAK